MDIFDEATALAAHKKEIMTTRTGGFGGSDAKLFLKIARKGLNKLCRTDLERIAISMGLAECKGGSDNEYTRSGHLFEDEAEKYLRSFIDDIDKETLLSAPLAVNFKTFAHADFTRCNGKKVIECKYFAKKSTEQTESEVMAQLQWYYLLGAEEVSLLHGMGDVENFKVRNIKYKDIAKRPEMQAELLKGITILDEAITRGWQPDLSEAKDVDEAIKNDFDMYLETLEEIEYKANDLSDLKKKLDEYGERIKAHMSKNGISQMRGEYKNKTHTCMYSITAGRRTFDKKKLFAEHPELDLAKYYNVGEDSATLKFV